MNISPIFSLSRLYFGHHQPLREVSGSLAAKCSPVLTSKSPTVTVQCCGVEQVADSRFLKLYHRKQLPAEAENDTELKLVIKLYKAEGSCTFK